MKKTNFILAILLLISFSGCFSQDKKSQTNKPSLSPKNVILLIGDGMGHAQITAGMIAKGDALNIEKFPFVGMAKTYSADNLITDSAAGGTALATGNKTNNGAIGVDAKGSKVKSLTELASEKGLSTGLVATSSITHATPASFFAHQASRKMEEEIAMDMINASIDVFIGGGKKFFETRTDQKNISEELKKKQFQILYSTDEAKKAKPGKIGVLAYDEAAPSMINGRGEFLPDATDLVINRLSENKKGFFIMIEGSQIDWAGHANDLNSLTAEYIDFDKAIGKALDFAKKDGNTLIVITADHETGGFAITGGSLKEKKVTGEFVSKNHTGVVVPVFAYGPGAEEFSGFYENTEIFMKIKKLMGL